MLRAIVLSVLCVECALCCVGVVCVVCCASVRGVLCVIVYDCVECCEARHVHYKLLLHQQFVLANVQTWIVTKKSRPSPSPN